MGTVRNNMSVMDETFLLLLNSFLLIGAFFPIVFGVFIFKKSPYDDWPYLSFVIAIGLISTFFIVNYITTANLFFHVIKSPKNIIFHFPFKNCK